jgi:uroporphyrin-III C-methyltransferase
VPLTHRDHSQGVILVTGHGKSADAEPDWATLAKLQLTLVIYMGINRCSEIVAALLAGGKPADTPAAVIHAATGNAQTQLITTLAQLPAALRRSGLGSPGIIVIGEVVRCATQLQALGQGQAIAA